MIFYQKIALSNHFLNLFFYSIDILQGDYGRLAQLVRAPRRHRGGHWFEPSIDYKT